jgi:hypothetical protein
VRPKTLPLTGAAGQRDQAIIGAEASARFRDAMTVVGLSQEAAALALACSPSRVQAKADPGRNDAPVTYADLLRLARAGGKAREVVRVLHADLGAELEDRGPLPLASSLPLLGMQWSAQAANVSTALADFCASPGEQARGAALRAIGSASGAMQVLRGMLANQRAA